LGAYSKDFGGSLPPKSFSFLSKSPIKTAHYVRGEAPDVALLTKYYVREQRKQLF
jgi:hypothetical protein